MMLGFKRNKFVLSLVVALTIAASPAFSTTPNPVPSLDPVMPAAATPGGPAFTLTVTGTGFVAASSVDWNGTPRTTTFVNASKLTAAISASDIANPTTATITVVSPAPGGGSSNIRYFGVANVLPNLSFTPLGVTGKNNLTSPVIGADFNKDGKADLAVASGSNVYVLLGNNDGTFQSPIGSGGPSGTITGIHVADVNSDGTLDLIVTGSKTTKVSFVATMLGNGDGTFQAPIETDFNGAISPSAVVADFNGDGNLDLAYATATTVQVLLGSGTGAFTTGPITSLAQIGRDTIATGDFNHDGIPDLVITVYDPFTTGFNYAGVLLGNGDGSFGPINEVAGSGTSYVGAITAAVGDFNGDGNLDIATAVQTVGQITQGYIMISLGNGDGTFQQSTNVPNVNIVSTPLLLADMNGDGKLDLATGGYIYYGAGDGTFPNSNGSSTSPTLVLALDVNGDGRPDLVTETAYLNGSQVLTSIGLDLQLNPLPDFQGIVSPFNPTLIPGGSVVIPITLEAIHGFTGDVVINASDLPNGLTPAYNPVLIHGGSGNATITLTASPNLPIGQYTIILTGNSGQLSHSTTVTLNVATSVGDFTGSVAQSSQNTTPGGTATYQITVSPLSGFTGNVALNVAGLPPGATATFSPATVSGGSGTSTLTVITASSTPQPSIYNLTVSGSSGSLVHNLPLSLGVSNSHGDFSATITPSVSVSSAGGNGSYTLTVTPINGGASDVTASLTGLPSGATVSYSPATIVGSSGSSTITVTVAPGTAQGSYPLTVTLVGSGVAHIGGTTLNVTP